MSPDYYEILGVTPTATIEEIKRAYRQLARTFHPDVYRGGPEGDEIFKDVTQAYYTLSDANKRAEYDQEGGGNRRSAPPPPSPQRPTPPRHAPPPPPNPYEARISQIAAELNSPLPKAPCGALDANIQALERELGSLANHLPENPEQCPGCKKKTMTKHTKQVSRVCPLCREADLVQRPLVEGTCAVCHGGKLTSAVLPPQESFCPVCHNAVMKCERRKRFGVALDLWWVCPRCKTEIDVFTGGRAKLVTLGEDPHGTGAAYVGQVLPLSEWRKLAGRSDMYSECERCSAQFEAPDGERLKLVATPDDHYGVGGQHLGKTLPKSAWAKIAAGIPLTAGNVHCPKCAAEFDHHQSGGERTLKCLAMGANPLKWADEWLNRQLPIQTWHLAMSGKSSLHPGLRCDSCATEFDLKGGQHQLVATTVPDLLRHIGECHSLEDWQRLVNGLPSLTREEQMRKEIGRLRALKEQEERQWAKTQEQQRDQLQAELDRLLKEAYFAGAFALQPREKRAGLRPEECLLWESPGEKLKVRTYQGYQYYEADLVGTLLVTDERLVFVSGYGQVWQRKFNKLAAAEMAYCGSQRVLLAWFVDLQKPVPFVVSLGTMSVTVSGRTCTFNLGMDDLERLLNVLI